MNKPGFLSRRARAAGALCFAALLATPAHALLVDTGPGPNGGGASLYDDRPETESFQSLAARFSVTAADTVTSVQGWLNWYYGGGLTLSIHEEFQGLPGATLHTVTVTPLSTGLNEAAWRGASGLNWQLTTGDYWLVFEDVADSLGSGSMPGPVGSPLAGYASGNELKGWSRADTLALGVRINAIPEPTSVALMLGGLVLVGTAVRRRAVAG